MSFRVKFLKAASWASFSQYSIWIINLAGTVALARLITPADFGSFTFYTSIKDGIFVFTGWSFSSAYIAFPSPTQQDKHTFFWLHALTTGACFMVSVMLAAWMYASGKTTAAAAFFILAAAGTIQVLGYFFSAELERDLSYRIIAMSQVFSKLAATIVAVTFAYRGAGLWSLVYANLIEFTVPSIIILFQTRYRPIWGVNRDTVRWAFTYSSRMFLRTVLEFACLKLDRFLVGSRMSREDLGQYARASSTSDWSSKLTGSIFVSVAFPAYSHLQKDPEKSARVYLMLNSALSRGLLLVFLPTMLLARPLFALVYGPNWSMAALLFTMLIGDTLLNPLFANLKEMFSAQGRPGKVLKVYIMRACVYLPLLFWVVHKNSIIGVALATSLDLAIGYLLLLNESRKLGLSLQPGKILTMPIVIGLLAAGGYFAGRAWGFWYTPISLPAVMVQFMLIAAAIAALMATLEHKRIIRLFHDLKSTKFSG